VAVVLISNLTKVVAKDFYERTNSYFDTAIMLSVIWLAAILFSQQRQYKAAEKERILRQKEDEINRAIAARKVELEGLVAERTVELTTQKEELQSTLDELRTTQAQLIQSEKMASLGELTAGIAHEIQNPLNFVNNFSEVNQELLMEMNVEIEKGNLDEVKLIIKDIIENEQKINHHGKRADAIVKGMLQHSRSSSGIKEPTEINALADEYLRLAYHGLRAKDKSFNATMKTDFDKSIGKLKVVPQDLGRVILNLITNAFYAVNEKKKAPQPPGGALYEPTVTVRTSFLPPAGGQRGTCLISVSDNGNGIPQSALDKVFQPFFTTKPSGQGTGLGLSMSYEIVTKGHGGELKVENKIGEGATFTIVLPV
jgi:signal transduction histidine kinase